MGRPRQSAKILELKGSFRSNPGRERTDAPGAGPFDHEPPDFLNGPEIAAWRQVVDCLPAVALTQSEMLGVAQMAKIWAALKVTSPTSGDFKKLDDSFRQWCVQMGLTLQARIKLGTDGNGKAKNEYAELDKPAG